MTVQLHHILFPHKFSGWLVAVLLALVVCACVDDLDAPERPDDIEENLPAVIQLNVSLSDRTQLSRADVPDTRITSLWIGIFSATTGEIKGKYTVSNAEIENIEHQTKTITLEDARSGLMHIVGVANYEHRYIVHKTYDGTIETLPMNEALADLKDYDDYLSMAATYTADGDVTVDQPINAMLMTGVYTEENHTNLATAPAESMAQVTPSTKRNPYVAPGVIHLRRLISENTFNITYNAANIKSMDIVNWQVHNVPNSAWLRERYDDDALINSGQAIKIDGASVVDTEQFTTVSQNGNKTSFSFWQLESRHTGLEPDASFASRYYDYRENEFKNEDGSNTGKYKSLLSSVDDDSYAANATYVTFTADLEMLVDEKGNSLADAGLKSRNVRAIFTVHLGYCENKSDKKLQAMDFNCRRNAKYTYNITLNNVNSMVVEASNGTETPSVEGTITDITDRYERIDAHYHLMNVTFTKTELDNFTFNIEAHDNSGVHYFSQNNVPDESNNELFRLYSWVEFRRTSNANTFAEYKPHSDGDTYYLHEMKGRAAGTYTMFINEYAYERFDDNGDIYPADKTNWHWFCGAPDRRVWLNVQAETSPDGQTLHHKSKYAISQRSIQTYYSTAVDKALGVEHVNETLGANMRNNWNNETMVGNSNGVGFQGTSGRYLESIFISAIRRESYSYNAGSNRTAPWTNDISWNTFIDFGTPFKTNAINNRQGLSQEAKTHTLPSYKDLRAQLGTINNRGDMHDSYSSSQYDPDNSSDPIFVETMAACLNRNRDNNGDGIIDANELRWFIPSEMQVVRIILGRQALTTPIMDYSSANNLTYGDVNRRNSRWLIGTASGNQVWAMEGLSTSKWGSGQYGERSRPWNVRCVRYVGSDISDFHFASSVPPPYDDSQNPLITMTRMSRLALRDYTFIGGESDFWPAHLITNPVYNRSAHSFEISTEVLEDLRTFEGAGVTVYTPYAEYLNSHNPCARLNTETKKGWRVPNQKELVTLCNLRDSNGRYYHSPQGKSGYFVSSSLEYFQGNSASAPSNPSNPTQTELNNRKTMVVWVGGRNGRTDNPETIPDGNALLRCVRDID